MSPAGKPKADKPKEVRYSVRLDVETEETLKTYCENHGIIVAKRYVKEYICF